MSADLTLYCVYHTPSMIGSFPRHPSRTTIPLLLPDLPVDTHFGDTCESKALLYLSGMDVPETPYIAFVQASWPEKFKYLDIDVAMGLRVPNTIVAPATDAEWYTKSERNHPGITPYLDRIMGEAGLGSTGIGVFCNSMLMERDAWVKFLSDWKVLYDYTIETFDPENLDFEAPRPHHKPAYLCERITTMLTASYGNVKGLGWKNAEGVVMGYQST